MSPRLDAARLADLAGHLRDRTGGTFVAERIAFWIFPGVGGWRTSGSGIRVLDNNLNNVPLGTLRALEPPGKVVSGLVVLARLSSESGIDFVSLVDADFVIARALREAAFFAEYDTPSALSVQRGFAEDVREIRALADRRSLRKPIRDAVRAFAMKLDLALLGL